jgi:hypothetical protein
VLNSNITLVHQEPIRNLIASTNDANNNSGNNLSQNVSTDTEVVSSTNVSLTTAILTSTVNTKPETIMHVAQSNLEDSEGNCMSRVCFVGCS